MIEHEINSSNLFINGWYLEDTTICDQIIEYHQSPDTVKSPGRTIRGIDKNWKDSTDTILEGSLLTRYVDEVLKPCTDLYRKAYPACNVFGEWEISQPVNVQKYDPGGGFHAWHTERTNKAEPAASRHIVFMTYLNDVEDAGETEFYHQKVKIKPKKGLTLLWGVDWTFTHRGVTSPSQTKYIVTGWWCFSESYPL
jgi:hypothetical protein